MHKVYLLHHVREYGDEQEHEDCKLIGVYSSREYALAAQGQVRDQPGFRDHPGGFSVDEHVVDRTGWVEGFISSSEALDDLE